MQPVGCTVTPEQVRHLLLYSFSRSKAPNLLNQFLIVPPRRHSSCSTSWEVHYLLRDFCTSQHLPKHLLKNSQRIKFRVIWCIFKKWLNWLRKVNTCGEASASISQLDAKYAMGKNASQKGSPGKVCRPTLWGWREPHLPTTPLHLSPPLCYSLCCIKVNLCESETVTGILAQY